MLKYHIQTIEVGAGGAASIGFSNIPQDYDDLLIEHSLRSDRNTATGDNMKLSINGQGFGTNITTRTLYGTGSVVGSFTAVVSAGGVASTVNATSNTFGNNSFYIANYTGSSEKSISLTGVSEHSGTEAYQYIGASLWNQTAAVTSIDFDPDDGSLLYQYSSASLYGIKHGTSGEVEVASGGEISYSGGYTIHTFESSGTFVANRNLDVEYLVVAGGGGGGSGATTSSTTAERGAGGGAGGYRSSVSGESSGGGASAESTLALAVSTSYTVTVGAGGAGGDYATSGVGSSFSTITSSGGGHGAYSLTRNGEPFPATYVGADGGSGGGSHRDTSAGGYGSGTPNQGYRGGGAASNNEAGGGGGAGSAGTSNVTTSGGGGSGVSSSITGSAVTRAEGGGVATAVSAASSTGSGGGGALANTALGGNGGSGVVIIRYLTP